MQRGPAALRIDYPLGHPSVQYFAFRNDSGAVFGCVRLFKYRNHAGHAFLQMRLGAEVPVALGAAVTTFQVSDWVTFSK
jgi:hypothetical protein